MLIERLVERSYREGKVHYELAQSYDALMRDVFRFSLDCDDLDHDAWIDRKIGIRAHSLASAARSLSVDLTKAGLNEAGAAWLQAVAAIVETARVRNSITRAMKQLESARPSATTSEREQEGPRSVEEVLERVVELAWSTEEWLLHGNWNQRWASICNVYFAGAPDRVLAKPAGVTANALRVARRKARATSARHTAYAAINMIGLCEPARLPKSVVPVLENAIDGEPFAPIVRQMAASLLMASDVREHRRSAATLLRETIKEVGDNDGGRLESFAAILEADGKAGWIEDEDDERVLEWQEEIANQHF